MEQATQPKAPQPRLPRGREEKGLFDGLDAKLEEGEYHLLADLDGSAGDDGVSAIRLVCEVNNGSGFEKVGDTVRINDMTYEHHKENGQEVGEEHRVQVENGQEKYVIPFKVTGLDNKPTYYFRTQLKTQDAWIEPKSDPKRRNTANTKKRKAAAAPAPAPALTPLVNEQVPQEDDDDVQMDDADPPAAAPTAPVTAEPTPEGNTDERAEEDESDSGAAEGGKLMKVKLETPNITINTFELMWAWILQAIEKSHKMKSVPKGNFFEQVCKAILQEIYSNANSVKIKGAATSGTQGDDGRDIVVAYSGEGPFASLPNRIFDCKNFKTNKATRPHVRSVIGSMMTYSPIVERQKGVGILLTTTTFTEPAKKCAEKFNKLQKDITEWIVELWNLDKLRDELRARFPDRDDEDDDDDSGSKVRKERNMVNRLLQNIKGNLEGNLETATPRLADFVDAL